MKPKLSIVICTYNRAESLAACLESLAKQTRRFGGQGFNNFEVIIVDGGSTDETNKVTSEYLKKLTVKRIIYQEKELARARDKGWREAQGEFISFIDDDVVASPNWAKSIVEIFEKNPDVGGISGPTIVPKELLANRDVFWFYNPKGCFIRLLSKFWNRFFLEGGMHEVGRIFKSGAWSPGSNFPQCLQIKGLKDVDYLEACNMSLRRELIAKVNGFDYGFCGTAEWCEVDLAMRVKKLDCRLVFSSQVRVDHKISQAGVYPRRVAAKQRMENFLRFYFRHIFKFRLDYIFKFKTYVLFLNLYWGYKASTTKNIDWLGGWVGTITGLRFLKTDIKSESKPLKRRYQANKTAKFQRAQTELFLNLLNEKYDKVLEVGCGKGFFSYVGTKNMRLINCYGCDVFADFQIEEIKKYAKSVIYKQIEGSNLPFASNSFDLVFSMDVIEHINDDIKFIKENIRVCKKGGEIITGTPNYLRITNLFLMLLGQLKFPRNMGKDAYGDCIHIREYKIKELVNTVIEASNKKLHPQDLEIYPCWLGIVQLNLGLKKFPSCLNNLCHFFFVKFRKPNHES